MIDRETVVHDGETSVGRFQCCPRCGENSLLILSDGEAACAGFAGGRCGRILRRDELEAAYNSKAQGNEPPAVNPHVWHDDSESDVPPQSENEATETHSESAHEPESQSELPPPESGAVDNTGECGATEPHNPNLGAEPQPDECVNEQPPAPAEPPRRQSRHAPAPRSAASYSKEQIRAAVSLVDVVREHVQLERRGRDHWGRCPFHEESTASFKVDGGGAYYKCHGCGAGGDVFQFLMEIEHLTFPEAKRKLAARAGLSSGPGREVAVYDYTDEGGATLFQVVRFEPKTFRQRKLDGTWGVRGVRQVPYRLHKLAAASIVFIAEGEKDVSTLEALGLTATCNAGGAGKWRPEYADYLAGKKVAIIPDNDAPGRNHAAQVARSLLGKATEVRIVEVLGHKDVSDWATSGGSVEQLRELARAAEPLDVLTLSELQARWGLVDEEAHHQAHAERADGWPKPEPIQSELPPVRVFGGNLLPRSFRPLVCDVVERMQVPMDYPAVVMVLCLAGAVNRRATIQPKANDTGWIIVPNLWGGIIAPPGFMKSPVIQAATRPLNQIQAEWRQEHKEALRDHARAKEESELRRAAWREQYKASAKRGEAAPDRPEDEPKEPALRRLVVNDATFEALHQTMSENPAGIFVVRDELTGWWTMLDRAGREGERAFCLQAWNGDTGHTVDRIGRGTIHVEQCCMSMLGGIQPGRLRSYLVDALRDGPSNDGLIQRFQLLVWPDTAPDWSYVDRAPDAASEQQAARAFRKLVELDAENPAQFRFASDAQELFIEWLAELEAKIRGDELHPALISHLSKYRKLMPALALLFELADWAAGYSGADTVTLEHARRAAAWCEYLESHARRVYFCIVTPQLRAARELADKIKRLKVGTGGFFSCRDVYLKGWSGLDTPEAVRQAADVLQDAGWVRDLPGETGPLGGRPSNRYQVNPRLWE